MSDIVTKGIGAIVLFIQALVIIWALDLLIIRNILTMFSFHDEYVLMVLQFGCYLVYILVLIILPSLAIFNNN